jgi:hypothetical protein
MSISNSLWLEVSPRLILILDLAMPNSFAKSLINARLALPSLGGAETLTDSSRFAGSAQPTIASSELFGASFMARLTNPSRF